MNDDALKQAKAKAAATYDAAADHFDDEPLDANAGFVRDRNPGSSRLHSIFYPERETFS
jgi:hypothetical protein